MRKESTTIQKCNSRLTALGLNSDAAFHLSLIHIYGQLAVLKKALTAAAELSVGLLEATEVVEPNPLRPNELSLIHI